MSDRYFENPLTQKACEHGTPCMECERDYREKHHGRAPQLDDRQFKSRYPDEQYPKVVHAVFNPTAYLQ